MIWTDLKGKLAYMQTVLSHITVCNESCFSGSQTVPRDQVKKCYQDVNVQVDHVKEG